MIHAAFPETVRARQEPDFVSAPGSTRLAGVSAVATETGRPRATILIAEDHADSRDALRTLLDAFGYRVEVAENGRKAVETAITLDPDLILMDVMMPEMDGFEATRALRANDRIRQVPIVALTAMEGAREQVLAAGCDDYVSKPIDVRAFLGKVENWLHNGRAVAR